MYFSSILMKLTLSYVVRSKKNVTRHAREEKHMTILISEMTWKYTAGLAFRARIEILEHTLSQNLKLLAEVGYG